MAAFTRSSAQKSASVQDRRPGTLGSRAGRDPARNRGGWPAAGFRLFPAMSRTGLRSEPRKTARRRWWPGWPASQDSNPGPAPMQPVRRRQCRWGPAEVKQQPQLRGRDATMADVSDAAEVTDNHAESRFELQASGRLAELMYR